MNKLINYRERQSFKGKQKKTKVLAGNEAKIQASIDDGGESGEVKR